jgi:hypothetical protein
MHRLTLEERQRAFLDRQTTRQTRLARLNGPTLEIIVPRKGRRGHRRLLKITTLVILLGGGLLAYQVLDFQPPVSMVEALLPRP